MPVCALKTIPPSVVSASSYVARTGQTLSREQAAPTNRAVSSMAEYSGSAPAAVVTSPPAASDRVDPVPAVPAAQISQRLVELGSGHVGHQGLGEVHLRERR